MGSGAILASRLLGSVVLWGAVLGRAGAEAAQTQLTPQSLQRWVSGVCQAYSCTPYNKPFAALKAQYGTDPTTPGHAYLIGRGKDALILYHDVRWQAGEAIMNEIAFYPTTPASAWTDVALQRVTTQLNRLGRGNLSPQNLKQCRRILKESELKKSTLPNYEGPRLAGILMNGEAVVAVAGCHVLPGRLNIAFGYTSRTR